MTLALSAADRAALIARHKTAIDGSLKTKLITIAVVGGLLGLFLYGLTTLETSLWKILSGFSNLGTFVVLMLPPDPGSFARAIIFIKALFETIAIAFLGTILAAILAFPLGFLAAKNVVANRVVHFLARRSMDTVRGVDALIWALIWVNVVGLGPFAGMLAIMTSDLGAFGKLFSEAIESADRKPVEGVTSVGGGKFHEIRFGLIPQVLPVIASQVLYYIESNTRSSTIIGIVGAGGIGLYLAETIRTLEWQQVSFLILLVLAAVTAIDFLSSKLRFAIIGKRAI
ncbi:Phosphonate transport system permease protein [Bosea sp. 62]|uniref:phosphonate ABC transporter, permease protein PhnE n=1 Tax=unclassified Bosea (in: a-proteobacteria) TaxID=2653178 RepID=UPI00125768DD|nr:MULTISPECIES: phosphonate ABC transporter, permease protein PhnE [unclassified Bosea (in: a-proteobacteria)]CAD5250563.1 Phosphonate transport system permease protein [Bosea sp. 7B]CAD5281279.1 Phosphonate transport system permease protein [Bosea sp. 21B]CAD5282969.1 Phosphonate transport system permease protein [Bosea sp. 46]VVT52355.1 Phosphonate transport system permease protein [Bosea sp. EC-HK365B]VXB24937.1 Phosphonate transport system permease protein [Bosea sp. 62]